MEKHQRINQLISIILIMCLLLPTTFGCGGSTYSSSTNSASTVSTVSDSEDNDLLLSEYVGDIDSLVYALISNEYSMAYDIFDAYAVLKDGSYVYGLAYTDYNQYYETEDGSGFYPAGFLCGIGENAIPKSEEENGLILYDEDCNEDSSQFVYAYSSQPFMKHCVVWDTYLKYGIDSEGMITYEVYDNNKDSYDMKLGNLYSFDEQKIIEKSDYSANDIETKSLLDYVDFDGIKGNIDQAVNDIDISLDTVKQRAHDAKQMLIDVLEKKKEEGIATISGFDISEIIEDIKNYDPLDIIEITEDGKLLIDIDNSSVIDKKELVKWLVGAACFINLGGCIALDIWVKWLAPLSGAVSGASIEAFVQVVIEDQDFEDIVWEKVAVSSVTGAAFAWLIPAAASGAVKVVAETGGSTAAAKVAGYATQAVSSAIVSAAASAGYAVIDEKDEKEVWDAALMGATLGLLLSAVGSAMGEVMAKAENMIIRKNANSWLAKASKYIEEHQVHLSNKKLEEILTPKSVHQAIKLAEAQGKFKESLKSRVNQLIRETHLDYILTDPVDGHILSKEEIIANGGNCVIKLKNSCSDKVKTLWDGAGVKALEVKNGFVDFSDIAIDSFSFLVTSDRDANMAEYYKKMALEWSKDASAIPENIKSYLINNGVDLNAISASNIRQAFSDLALTFHEGANNTVYIVSRDLHQSVSHYGGVAWAKAMDAANVGINFFNQIKTTVSSFIFGTLVPEFAGD